LSQPLAKLRGRPSKKFLLSQPTTSNPSNKHNKTANKKSFTKETIESDDL
jgi:hypothetical protein